MANTGTTGTILNLHRIRHVYIQEQGRSYDLEKQGLQIARKKHIKFNMLFNIKRVQNQTKHQSE